MTKNETGQGEEGDCAKSEPKSLQIERRKFHSPVEWDQEERPEEHGEPWVAPSRYLEVTLRRLRKEADQLVRLQLKNKLWRWAWWEMIWMIKTDAWDSPCGHRGLSSICLGLFVGNISCLLSGSPDFTKEQMIRASRRKELPFYRLARTHRSWEWRVVPIAAEKDSRREWQIWGWLVSEMIGTEDCYTSPAAPS